MTNNPTIDGVSRELLNLCYRALNGGDNQLSGMEHGQAFRELRALLDAPAAERQELKPAVRVCGAGYDAERNTVWMETGVVEMPIMRKVEVGEELVFISEAQSTISQLQARIAELESGRGEPVAWANGYQLKLCEASPREVEPNNPMIHNLPRNIAGSALKTGYCNTPLYAAPTAPVAVVLPERKDMKLVKDGGYWKGVYQGWNTCLDATAALNTPKPTEWYDVAGDDEGVSL